MELQATADRPLAPPVRTPSPRGPAAAVPADEPRRDGGPRVGVLRHRAGDGDAYVDHPSSAWPSSAGCSSRRASGSASSRSPTGTRRSRSRRSQAEPVLRRHRRQPRFDGEPLHGGPAAAPRRRLHGRRRGRKAPGPLHHRLHAALPRGLQGRAGRARRIEASLRRHRALRLLVRQGAPLDPGGRQGGPADLRQRRARRGRGGEPPRGRRGAAPARRDPGRRPVPPRAHPLHRAARRRPRLDGRGRDPPAGRDRDPAARLRAGQGRQGGLRAPPRASCTGRANPGNARPLVQRHGDRDLWLTPPRSR